MKNILKSTFILLVASNLVFGHVDVGLLTVTIPESDDVNFCVKYYTQLYNISNNATTATRYQMDDLLFLDDDVDLCNEDTIKVDLKGKIVIAPVPQLSNDSSSNCSLDDQAQLVHDKEGLGLILRTSNFNSNFNSSNSTDGDTVVASLYKRNDSQLLQNLAEKNPSGKEMYLVRPAIEKQFDWSLIVILVMACFCVSVGSACGGYAKMDLIIQDYNYQATKQVSEDNNEAVGGGDGNAEGNENTSGNSSKPLEDPGNIGASPLLILVFVCIMCGFLLLLYFFFAQLVYLIIFMFCWASFVALFAMLEPLLLRSYKWRPSWKVCYFRPFFCCKNNRYEVEFRQAILGLICLCPVIIWVVYRKASWAWILQDSLGIIFSINMLRTVRLPSIKIIALLFSGLFIYDIFFVFVTPLMTKNGLSIMEEVATGGAGGSGEQLPMVLKVPHLIQHPLLNCFESYSMLGFGDILVPGLLISYCHSYDLQRQGSGRWVYWMVANFFYFVGMITTFASLFLMNQAQPALLYLCPLTLIPVCIVAYFRGDFGYMWRGEQVWPPKDDTSETPMEPSNPENTNNADATTVNHVNETSAVVGATGSLPVGPIP